MISTAVTTSELTIAANLTALAASQRRVAQELAGDLHIALLIRVRHGRPVLPLSRPLHGLGEVHRVLDGAGIDERPAVFAETEFFGQALLPAAGQRHRKHVRMFVDIRRLDDARVALPVPDRMAL